MSAKDRVVLERVPHLVLDGAAAAAAAVGAEEVVVAVPAAAVVAHAALRSAIAERGDGRHVRVQAVPEAFLTGEETALVQALEGRRAIPTVSPPRPSERGLGRRPTLVQNAETLAHLALVARHGPAWFRALGTPGHPGSALVTLGGGVRAAGVHEIALGTGLQTLLDALGEPRRAHARGPARRLPRHLGRRGGRPRPDARPRRAGGRRGDARRGRRRGPATVRLPGLRGRPRRGLAGRRRPPASAARASTGWRRSATSSPGSRTGAEGPGTAWTGCGAGAAR